MNKPLMALAGLIAAGGTTAGAVIVASSGGEEEVVQQVETRTSTPSVTSAGTATAVPTPTPAPSPGSPTATPAWSTFTNTAYGYSFEYPAGWLIDPHNRRDQAISDYVDLWSYLPAPQQGPPPSPGEFRDKLKMEFVIVENPEMTDLEHWVADFHANAATPTTVVTTSAIVVNELMTIRQTVSFGGDHRSLVAFVDLGGRILLINGPQADTLFLSSYEHILGSVRTS